MPSLCLYKMCHNLGSSTFLGYCNVYHMERGLEEERKEAQKQREEKETKQKESVSQKGEK
jgi:hypothetical protein